MGGEVDVLMNARHGSGDGGASRSGDAPGSGILPHLRNPYGGRPSHLLAMLITLGLATYAWTRIFQHPEPWKVVLWFIGAIVVHDFVLLPLYLALYAAAFRVLGAARGPGRVMLLHHLVVPAVISCLLLLVWLPEILRLSSGNLRLLAHLSEQSYLGRWLAITGALFVGSAVLYLTRRRALARSRR
jgi:hypothetical protein